MLLIEKDELIDRLHQYNYKKRVKWKVIADYVNVHPSTLSLFLAGKRDMAEDRLEKLEKLVLEEM